MELDAPERDSAPTPLSGGRDEMIAHALMRGAARRKLDSIDEIGDSELRATLPPPEEMANHVARMMAEAAKLEAAEHEGDRPTMEGFEPSNDGYEPKLAAPVRERTPGAAPVRAAGSVAVRPSTAVPVRHSPQPFGEVRPVPAARTATLQQQFGTSPPPAAPVRHASQPIGAVRPVPAGSVRHSPQPFPAARPSPAGSVRHSPQPFPAARPSPGASPHHSPQPFPAVRPSGGGISASLSPQPFPAVRPPPAVPARPASGPRPSPVTPGPPPRPPSGPRPSPPKPTTPSPARGHTPLELPDLSDLSDLPAVFSLDSWGPEQPASDAAISPSFDIGPLSPAAISAPFASLELPELMRDPETEKIAAIEARFSAGDYSRALVLAETALEENPQNPAANKYAESCRNMLYERYLERLGAAAWVPQRAMQNSALTGLALDHRSGFLLSCVDGVSTIEELIDVSAMPRLEAVRILYELVQEGVIEMASPH